MMYSLGSCEASKWKPKKTGTYSHLELKEKKRTGKKRTKKVNKKSFDEHVCLIIKRHIYGNSSFGNT
jgi:hypothetical protein